jgi:hypothetical protein
VTAGRICRPFSVQPDSEIYQFRHFYFPFIPLFFPSGKLYLIQGTPLPLLCSIKKIKKT